jgi:hypothetical protein
MATPHTELEAQDGLECQQAPDPTFPSEPQQPGKQTLLSNGTGLSPTTEHQLLQATS